MAGTLSHGTAEGNGSLKGPHGILNGQSEACHGSENGSMNSRKAKKIERHRRRRKEKKKRKVANDIQSENDSEGEEQNDKVS